MANGFVSLNVEGANLAISNLAEIKSPALQEKIVRRAARQVMKSAKDRVRKQVDMNDGAFGDYSTNTRHKRPRRRKMLFRLVNKLRVIPVSSNTIAVGWYNRVDEIIAAKHQYGFSQNINKRDLAEADSQRSKAPISYKQAGIQSQFGPTRSVRHATRQQAIALIMANYKVHITGRGKDRVIAKGKGAEKTPSIKWITENLTLGEAGLILRKLRKDGGREQWRTTLPARPFLGITPEDLESIALQIRAEIDKTLKGAK